jgi:hypothetical protein
LDRSVRIAVAREKRGVAAPTITPSFRTSRCKVKSVGGTVQMTWNDGTTSTASVSGSSTTQKALALTGAFAATDPICAGEATTLLLDNFPPDPCSAATNPITGSLAISTA